MCAARSDLTPLAHLSLPSAIPDYALNQLERSRKFGCYEGKEQEGDENPLDQLITMQEEMCCRVAQALKCISGSIHSEPEGLGVYKRSKEFLSNFFYRVIDTLYRPAAVSLDIPIKVMVSGRVSADGFGDLFHILRVYEIIKRTFPHWNLLVVCDVVDLEKRIVPIKCLISHCSSPILFDPDRPTVVYKDGGISFDSEVVRRCKENADDFAIDSSVLLNISHRVSLVSIDSFYRDFISIREYGRGYVRANFSKKVVHVMGLAPSQLGILTLAPCEKQLDELENQDLKQVLLGSGDSQSYHLSTDFVYGYIKDQDLVGGYKVQENVYPRVVSFIVACCVAFKNSSKRLDLAIPYSSTNCEALRQIPFAFFEECGIGKIELYHFQQSDLRWSWSSQSGEGKQLRLINPFPIDYQDNRILTASSEKYVACIGDGSLTEVLSEPKPKLPFYGVYETKENFFIGLVYLAYEILSKAFPEQKQFLFFDYLLALAELKDRRINYFETAQKIGLLMSKPETLKEYQIVRDYILKYHNANEAIIDLIARKAVESISLSAITSCFKELRRDFIKGKITLIDAYEEAKKTVEKQSLMTTKVTELVKEDPETDILSVRYKAFNLLYPPLPPPVTLPTFDPSKPPRDSTDPRHILYGAI